MVAWVRGFPVSENVAKCAQHPQPIQRLEELADRLAYAEVFELQYLLSNLESE